MIDQISDYQNVNSLASDFLIDGGMLVKPSNFLLADCLFVLELVSPKCHIVQFS